MEQPNDDPKGVADRLRVAMDALDEVCADRSVLESLSHEERLRFFKVSGDAFCPDPEERRLRTKALRKKRRDAKVAKDASSLAATGIRVAREKPVFTTPNVFAPTEPAPELGEGPSTEGDRHCYVCKSHFRGVHHFYDQMCADCGDLNYAKRSETADLTGRVALLTGGRVKIGYQAGIKLLRAGAALIVTTRFPRDSAARYAAEPDFDRWSNRLSIYGLDLRHTPSVEAFCAHIGTCTDRLDYIINNACQTVRRPPAFYEHMMQAETEAAALEDPDLAQILGPYEGLRSPSLLPEAPSKAEDPIGMTQAALLSQADLLGELAETDAYLFPEGSLDADMQQVDLRGRNSWRLLMAEVSTVELLETQLINAIAPFVLNARLRPLMDSSSDRDKHIVNVSAVEGQFYRRFKTTRHPHTNMAKSALNMMTRTSATDYHGTGIHMNAVDTGWVTDEDPAALAEAKRAEHRFHPPLDIVVGAARIVDPIIDGTNTGHHTWGKFLKDYREADW